MRVDRHALINQNKKFAISLQHLKIKVNGEVDFLHAGKNENLLQIDTLILKGMVHHFQSSQESKFAVSFISKKKLEIRLIFCTQINIKVVCKLMSTS